MRMTLRTRVVLAAGAAILLAVVVVGVGVSVLVAGHLRSSLDRDLRDRAAEVAGLSASAPAVLSTPGVLDARIGGQQLSVEVLDRRGRIVARSLALGGSLLPSAVGRRVIDSGRPEYAAGRLGEVHLRLYVAPLPTVGGSAAGGAVIVAASTSEIGETLDRLHTFTVFSGLGAVALAALTAFVLVRRALRPLGRLSAGAGEIERTADLGRRLPEPSTGDEVGQLALTLNRMLAALERAREVERRFLADASHELRSPVTALRGNVDYLLRHGHDEAALADLAADAERLSTLIDDLLTLSREDAGGSPGEAVRLDDLAVAAAAGEPRIAVDAPEPVAVRGDRAALERAILNLVENARLHGPAEGTITIAVRSGDGRARLVVRDEGVGLTAEQAEHAFDRFWRARRDTPGSGLGLAIVRATAQRHGGQATAAGSEFAIELPLLRELSNDPATPEVASVKEGPR
jgi:two-component system, OmpR family, sensor kinase